MGSDVFNFGNPKREPKKGMDKWPAAWFLVKDLCGRERGGEVAKLRRRVSGYHVFGLQSRPYFGRAQNRKSTN